MKRVQPLEAGGVLLRLVFGCLIVEILYPFLYRDFFALGYSIFVAQLDEFQLDFPAPLVVADGVQGAS